MAKGCEQVARFEFGKVPQRIEHRASASAWMSSRPIDAATNCEFDKKRCDVGPGTVIFGR
jgi:hypothetical protein